MDIRTMEYYLAVVREGNISGAAEALHVAQPSLSRQMRELEEELGTSLFIRGNRKIILTAEGKVLKKRAEEMLTLMQRTEEEISPVKNNITGPIRIGAGESRVFHYISMAAASIIKQHPEITVNVKSADSTELLEEIDAGLIDFAVIFSDADDTIYQSVDLPAMDHYGLLLRKDDPLAKRKNISFEDLIGRDVIVSKGASRHFKEDLLSKLNVKATYNLAYNASILVEDGLGIALCFDNIVDTSKESPLTFVPLTPEVTCGATLIWKRYQVLSPAVKLFADKIVEVINKDSL